MVVLFDQGTPKGLASALSTHTIHTAQSKGWDTLSNGALLDAAEEAGVRRVLDGRGALRGLGALDHRAEGAVAPDTDSAEAAGPVAGEATRRRRSWPCCRASTACS